VPGRTDYGDYFLLDVNAALQFGSEGRHRVNLRLENALDEEYAARVRDIAPDAGGARYAYFFLGTPRTLHASYSYRF
jgi:outer membrane receptor protein involved in Fe transport